MRITIPRRLLRRPSPACCANRKRANMCTVGRRCWLASAVVAFILKMSLSPITASPKHYPAALLIAAITSRPTCELRHGGREARIENWSCEDTEKRFHAFGPKAWPFAKPRLEAWGKIDTGGTIGPTARPFGSMHHCLHRIFLPRVLPIAPLFEILLISRMVSGLRLN